MNIRAKRLNSLSLRIFHIYSKPKLCLLEKTQSSYVKSVGILVRGFADHSTTFPKLPVPPLSDTLKKYLKSIKPLVSEEEFRTTAEIAEKFGAKNGLGESLQSHLEERARNTKNWLNEWWINAAYLDCRESLVATSTSSIVFSFQESHSLDDQLTTAALVAAGTLDYKIRNDNNAVPLNVGEKSIDLSEGLKIYGACRIPGIKRDSVEFHCHDPNPPKHFVVAYNNHFFKIDAYDNGGKVLSVDQLFYELKNCVERSTDLAHPVGILTTQNRDAWSKIYQDLCKDKLNKDTIECIQRCLFLVCIDGPINKSSGCRETDAVLQCLHGNGASENAGNRWFDKTLQFIIGKAGEVGVTGEHAPADGRSLIILVDYLAKYITDNKRIVKATDFEIREPKQLAFNITSDMENEIENAKIALQSHVDNLNLICFQFQGFGKDFIKSQKLSPDSFIQMAIQLAFYRIYKEPGAHYQSASTSKFLHGRTETIRSCSEEAVSFARTMLDPKAANSQKVKTLKLAIEYHRGTAKDAVNGFGIDRHLLGLRMTAIELGMEVPELFTDISFIKSFPLRLSTSQVTSTCDYFGGFNPVTPNGYGCLYNPRRDKFIFGISTLNSSPETNSVVFKSALEESLYNMKYILVQETDQ